MLHFIRYKSEVIKTKNIGNLTWQVVKYDLPIDVSVMSIDEKIDYRHLQRLKKNFDLTDKLRNDLEKDFIFINDLKDGSQEVYYMTQNFPNKMQEANQKYLLRQLIEKFPNRLKEFSEQKINEFLNSDDVKNVAISLKLKFLTLRGYFDHLLKEDRNAESYFESWLHRMNEQLRRDRTN